MFKIFAIGNSLTSDTTRFFTELAEHEEGYSKTLAMLIGGMNIEGHFERCASAAREHEPYINGITTRFRLSIPEAIATDEWDYIMFQQAYAHFENPEAIRKYYEYFAHYFSMIAPKSKVIILNTWAPYDTNLEDAEQNRSKQTKQYIDMADFAAEAMGLSKENIVPAGRVIDALIKKGVKNIYRDEVHLTLSVGRFAAALTLYCYLTGKSAKTVTFDAFKNPRTEEDFLFITTCNCTFPEISEKDIEIIKETVDEVLGL